MAVKLRLRRLGRKKRPIFGLVAADSRFPRDGRFIEDLGRYNPLAEPATVELNRDRIRYWLDQGAQPSDTVRSILSKEGVLLEHNLAKRGKSEDEIGEAVSQHRQRHHDQAEAGKKTTAEVRRAAALAAEATLAAEREAEMAKARAEAEAKAKADAEEAKRKVAQEVEEQRKAAAEAAKVEQTEKNIAQVAEDASLTGEAAAEAAGAEAKADAAADVEAAKPAAAEVAEEASSEAAADAKADTEASTSAESAEAKAPDAPEEAAEAAKAPAKGKKKS